MSMPQQSDLRHILSMTNGAVGTVGNVERRHEMSIGSTDSVKNANPPPRNPGTPSPKLVKEFNEAVDRSTTSNDRAQHSQDA
jgi:hypothetical protein